MIIIVETTERTIGTMFEIVFVRVEETGAAIRR